MAAKVEKKTTLKSWQDADAELKILAEADSNKKRIESKLNAELLVVQGKHQDELNKLNTQILGSASNIELFCEEHRADFGEKQSKELNYGIVGFRKGTPKLSQMKGWTWDAVKNVIDKSKKSRDMFLRTKTELDKNAILSSGLKQPELAKFGCQIVQDENFFYEPFQKESKAVA